ncbi:hypothetical protein GCM10011363_04940 [Marivita lacus]|uniref:Apea-like HEPN domain-containing protein n=1 Tax=Marivita lacus TaxID=1323742 RepID=A0ABQ1K809_9RHOB|nr:hypothetical protein [Marivita lacus]GGB91365.1 hypothetical protein GCM10011363_04940 [Marivita lacus]
MNGEHPLWAAGPAELLQHGISLISEQSDAKRRIAMILVDNAAELTMQTYLTLPKRVTGLQLSRRERDEYCKNFPSLLDGIEQHASDKIIGLNLGEFEWFHRLRNELYHQGNGLTIERKNVEVYAELCEKLFEALFGVELEIVFPENSHAELIGEFFDSWIKIERLLAQWAQNGRHSSSSMNVVSLNEEGELSAAVVMTFSEVQKIRNQLIHGEAEVDEMLRDTNMTKIKLVEHAVSEMAARKRQRSQSDET